MLSYLYLPIAVEFAVPFAFAWLVFGYHHTFSKPDKAPSKTKHITYKIPQKYFKRVDLADWNITNNGQINEE